MDKSLISLGLMSGTSMDGVDASIIKSDGDQKIDILCNKFKEYPNKFREKLNSYIKRIKDLEDISNNIDEYREIERELTLIHSEIANKILKIYKINLYFYLKFFYVPNLDRSLVYFERVAYCCLTRIGL